MSLRTVDIRYRRTDYRLNESVRQYGASVRPADEVVDCWTCKRRLRPASRIVRLTDPAWWQCVPCAIADDVLVPMEATV